jgi:hypothetical protein
MLNNTSQNHMRFFWRYSTSQYSAIKAENVVHIITAIIEYSYLQAHETIIGWIHIINSRARIV